PPTSRSRSRCSSSTLVCSGPSARTPTSISLACTGSGSYCHSPLICQVISSRWGGSHATTRPQSHSLPSTPRSYQRPPSRGSRIASAISAWPMWNSRGHQVLNELVKTRNAFSIGTPTVVRPLRAGLVDVSLMACSCLQVVGRRLGGLLIRLERLTPDAIEVGPQRIYSSRVDLIDPARALGPAQDQPAILEHPKVLRHRRPGDRQLFCQFPHGPGVLSQQLE